MKYTLLLLPFLIFILAGCGFEVDSSRANKEGYAGTDVITPNTVVISFYHNKKLLTCVETGKGASCNWEAYNKQP